MARPNAALSFEGTSVDLTEGQLLRIGKLLLKDEGISTSFIEFNALYLPLMQVTTAMSEWREPPAPQPAFTIRKRATIVTPENAGNFMDESLFERTLPQPDGSTLKTRPVLIDRKVNLMALLGNDGDFTDTIHSIKVTRIYLKQGNGWEVVDVAGNDHATFLKNPTSERNISLYLKMGEFFTLTGSCDVERCSMEIVSYSDADLIPYAVDLEVETISYNYHPAV